MGFTSTAFSTPNCLFFPRKTFRDRDFRVWKRRRLKSPKHCFLSPRNELGPPLEFISLLSQNWIPPVAAAALGFASALAFSLSNNQKKQIRVSDSNSDSNSRVLDIGEWILFTSATPFNRFVLLRCPSISFEGGEFLEDVNDKLVKEERHYVRLDGGRITAQWERENEQSEEQLEYQRVCVGTEDGGVISLDWPANLDLSQEHGLDTTVLLIPGTPEGSMDANVKSFVCECLRRGLFPVVMNPRGCAGSPLTTARLFTAADSDDICSAILFVTKARPWSTFMGVGWGYGANMLTKYLAEAGEKTPLTAAACIDNPFDLDEATRTSPYNIIIDKKLTSGLIDILKSNKELFQGTGKGFNVEKALSAESVRDFEEAISMISYGFEKLEEFYSTSSTRSLVGRLKIPVLYIENEDGSVPLFSIPRGRIAENPFTNLLLCSCLPSNFTAVSWYHQVTIEWLTAVELGLLKGRHPLLQDIDVTINPSKSLALVEGRMPATNGRLDKVLNAAEFDSPDAYMASMNEILRKNGAAAYVQFESNQFLQGKLDSDDEALSKNNGNNSIEANLPEVAESNPAESVRGQVLQTAQVVMNMLDATVPGTLKEEEKKKVLAAVSRGETLIKALQDAVPEDVRGKLTSSVSEILQAQGKNLNFDGLLRANQIANVSSGLGSKIKEKSANSDVRMEGDDRLSDRRVSASDETDSSISQGDVDEHTGVINGAQPQEEPANSSDLPESKSVNINGENMSSTKELSSQNNGDKFDSDTFSKQKAGEFSEAGESGSYATIKTSSSSSNAGVTDCMETVTQNNRSQDDEVSQPADKGTNMSAGVASEQELSDQSKTGSPADARASDTSEIPASSISEDQLSEKGDDDSKSRDEKLVQPLPSQQNTASGSRSLTFSVSQALDALTGLDDSTQAAVNSVFGVIEGMLTQLEEKKENDSPVEKGNENNDTNNHSVIKKSYVDCEIQLEKQIDGDDNEDTNPVDMESANGYISNPKMENNTASVARKNNCGEKSFIVGKLVAGNTDTNADISKLLLYAPSNPYTEAFYREYLRTYMLSKVQTMKPLYLDATAALFFYYNPEEGHWLLRGQPEDKQDIVLYNNRNRLENDSLFAEENVIDDIIEPSYVMLDSEHQGELPEELKDKLNNNPVHRDFNMEKSELSAKAVVLDSLKVEVNRRLSAIAMKEIKADLEADMEEVANTVYLAIQYDKEHSLHPVYSGSNCNIQECNQLNGNHVVEAISQAIQNTSHLKRVLPVGVIVGSTLSALRNSFDVAGVHDHKNTSSSDIDRDEINGLECEAKHIQAAIQLSTDEANHDSIPPKIFREQDDTLSSFADEDDGQKVQTENLNRDTLMVGAVTAALGPSAILSQQEVFMGNGSSRTTSSYSKKKHVKIETAKDKEVVDGKQSSIVTSLAEKAMSVAAPIVPTKEGGEVDQERLVAMLAELGQKRVLKLVGKLALLWGGLRGAMSLTDQLISFFHIAERPLWQRVLGFFFMALVLWSPVLVPLLPTLFHNWATHNSSRIVELACILGLYTAVTILIMQWGKRIRGHEYPLKQYGLDFMSSEKTQDFSMGFIGGAILVLSVQSVNALLGFTELSWPLKLISSSVDLTTKMKSYGQLFLLAAHGILAAAGVAFVEELLFRSWLLEEIAADLGYQSAILISALAFSLSQRSLLAVPGLWLLSLALVGARLRKRGSLFITIGMRTGIMASNFILQIGGFMTHKPRSHPWIGGTHPSQPFSGVVGLLSALLLAIILYPRQPGLRKKTPRAVRP